MIVRYVRECEYKSTGIDKSLILGKEYLVLGIIIMDQGSYSSVDQREPYVRVRCGDDDYPCLFHLKLFDIIDSRLPNEWNFFPLERGIYRLEPDEFTGRFWELFHDGDKEAEKTFHEVLKKIEVFHE